MDVPEIDRNVKYLVLTVLILLPIGAAHNLSVEDDGFSFGMCDHAVRCDGVELGGYCIGVQVHDSTCVNPLNASDARHAEAECALDAQSICNANPELSGMEWTSQADGYNGTSCTAWAEQEDIQLLKCEDTFADVTRWNSSE